MGLKGCSFAVNFKFPPPGRNLTVFSFFITQFDAGVKINHGKALGLETLKLLPRNAKLLKASQLSKFYLKKQKPFATQTYKTRLKTIPVVLFPI